MDKELQHQLRIMLEENDNGNYYELTKIISSFIDQNFIRKEEIKEDYIHWVIAPSLKDYKGKTPFKDWKDEAEVRAMQNWK
jgi:hypothetical protein